MSYTASTAFLEALVEAGVKYIYGNFGSDHPGILEAFAEAKTSGRRLPEVLTCPIEQVGLPMAMGYAHVRVPQGTVLMIGRREAPMCHGACRGTSSPHKSD